MVHATNEDSVKISFDVIVHFAKREPSPAEIMAVRQVVLQDQPIPYVRDILRDAAKHDWTFRIEGLCKQDAELIIAKLVARGVAASIT